MTWSSSSTYRRVEHREVDVALRLGIGLATAMLIDRASAVRVQRSVSTRSTLSTVHGRTDVGMRTADQRVSALWNQRPKTRRTVYAVRVPFRHAVRNHPETAAVGRPFEVLILQSVVQLRTDH